MKAGSSDSVFAFLGSLLIAILLFLGRGVINGRLGDLNEIGGQQQAPGQRSEQKTASRDNFPPAQNAPAEGSAKVVGIIDGDTVDILVNGGTLRLRLAGVDTPEKGQPFGNNARQALSELIGGQQVQYVVRDTDRYGRSIADIYSGNNHVNLWLVRQGLAWHYTAFSSDAKLAEAERIAKSEGRGLWSDNRPVAPWNWRKLSRVERDRYR